MSYIKRLLDQEMEMNNNFPDDIDWNAPTSDAATDTFLAKLEKENEEVAQSGIPAAFANMYR